MTLYNSLRDKDQSFYLKNVDSLEFYIVTYNTPNTPNTPYIPDIPSNIKHPEMVLKEDIKCLECQGFASHTPSAYLSNRDVMKKNWGTRTFFLLVVTFLKGMLEAIIFSGWSTKFKQMLEKSINQLDNQVANLSLIDHTYSQKISSRRLRSLG